ncbi:MAG: hypothetical protein NT141_02950 [candidate division WWE3 bacterium]|nr:hypothetical protein [candidate division WWE3 bacterium]
MENSWNRLTLGLYNPESRLMGVDYGKLYLDPLRAKQTLFHEVTHSLLTSTTDYGLAILPILNLLPKITSISREDKDKIKQSLMRNQTNAQEGLATLMELLMLRGEIGKRASLIWARANLTQEYYDWFSPMSFVISMSNRYRENFTTKISRITFQNGFRKACYERDLFGNIKGLQHFLASPSVSPDIRLLKLVQTVAKSPSLLKKSEIDICAAADVEYFPDATKVEVAEFINYLYDLAGIDQKMTEIDVKQVPEGAAAVLENTQSLIVANMNIRLSESGITLPEKNDLLHYCSEFEVVVVTFLSDELEFKQTLEHISGRKHDVGILAITKNGEKYIYADSFDAISSLLDKELKEKTLLVKWGLYQPGLTCIPNMDGCRKPDVVIFNSLNDLIGAFSEAASRGDKFQYLYLSSSEDHPFRTLVIKDIEGVLYMLNAWGNVAIDNFLQKSNQNFIRSSVDKFLQEHRHYNNAFAFWMNLPWDIDWYKTMMSTDHVIYR